MADEQIKIKFQLTLEDYVKFSVDRNMFIHKKDSILKTCIAVFKYMIIWLIICVIFALFNQVMREEITLNQIPDYFLYFYSYKFFICFFVAFIIIFCLSGPGLKRCFKQASRKIFNSGKNKALYAPIEMSFSPEIVSYHTPYQESKYKWDGLESVEIQNSDLCLFLSSATALYIPARFFASEQEKQAVFQKCQQWFLDAHKTAA